MDNNPTPEQLAQFNKFLDEHKAEIHKIHSIVEASGKAIMERYINEEFQKWRTTEDETGAA